MDRKAKFVMLLKVLNFATNSRQDFPEKVRRAKLGKLRKVCLYVQNKTRADVAA